MPSFWNPKNNVRCLIWGLGMVVAVGCIAFIHAAQANDEKPEKSLLLQSMETLNDSHRQLRRWISDPSMNERSLKLVAAMQKSALVAISQTPPKAKTLPKKEQPEFVLAYKRAVVELIGAILDLEAALLDADMDQAKRAHKKLGTIKRKGHGKFQEEE